RAGRRAVGVLAVDDAVGLVVDAVEAEQLGAGVAAVDPLAVRVGAVDQGVVVVVERVVADALGLAVGVGVALDVVAVGVAVLVVVEAVAAVGLRDAGEVAGAVLVVA